MTIREQLAGKTAAQREAFKAAEVAKINFRGRFTRAIKGDNYDVEILGIKRVASKGRFAVEVTARASRNGQALGFGKDGSVEIERFRFFNPPILVDDDKGPIVLETVDEDGVARTRRLREDGALAMQRVLAQTVLVVGKAGTRIVRGRVGNTTSTFFPSLDSRIALTGQNSTWAAIVAASAGSFTGDSDTSMTIRIQASGTTNQWQRLYRCPVLFDTSALPDADNIDSATLSIAGLSAQDNLGIAPDLDIYTSTPASDVAIVVEDFDQFGSTALSTGPVAYASLVFDDYNDWPLNPTGLAAISKTGMSRFGIRNANYDVAGSPPAWSNSANTAIELYASETSGTALDPMLVVEHSAAASGVDLVVHDAVVGVTADSPALTQSNQLVANDALVAPTADSPTLAQSNQLVANDALVAPTADSPTLAQSNQLVANDALVAPTADSPALTQSNQLVANDALVAPTADSPALAQSNQLVANDALVASSADAVSLAQADQLSVADALVAPTADSVALVQSNQLAVAGALVAVNIDNVVLQQSHILVVARATVHALFDTPALLQAGTLAVFDALVNATAEHVALSQLYTLSVHDATVVVAADAIALLQSHQLVVQDALVQPSAEAVQLIQSHLLEVADALVALGIDNIVLVTNASDDMLVGVRISGATITGVRLSGHALTALRDSGHALTPLRDSGHTLESQRDN